MSQPDGLGRAACYGQDDDAAWVAAWHDVEHHQFMISGLATFSTAVAAVAAAADSRALTSSSRACCRPVD